MSGYHALSFTIEHVDSYIPFRSPCMQRPFPLEETKEDIPFSQIVASLPFPKKCELILILNNIITLRTVPTLTQVPNPFPDNAALTEVYNKYQEQLHSLSKSIQQRNNELRDLGRFANDYLDPSKVEASLSI